MITIPTTAQLFTDIKSDLEAAYGSTIPIFGKVYLYALCLVQAAKMKLLYLYIASVQKNIAPDTADSEFAGGTLERFGRIKLKRNPFPATAGQYTLTVVGTSGTTIPAQTVFRSNDDSLNPAKLFILDTAYLMPGTTGTITVRALEAGTDSKMFVGEGMTATAPIINISQQALVASEAISPTEAESIETYRSKVIEGYRLEPQGGSPGDYRIWSSDAVGVLSVYPYAVSGSPWQTNVYVEATIADSIDGLGTPSPTILANVDAVLRLDPDTSRPINERGRKPNGVILNVIAVDVLPVVISVNGFVGMTAEINTLLGDALEEYIKTVRPFIAGAASLEDKNDILDLNGIISTILSARPGSVFGAVTMTVDGVSESTHTFIQGEIPYISAINYI